MGIVQDVVIVVPCFNEAARLDVAAFGEKLATSDKLRFLFVDDGSTDHTECRLHELALAWPGRALPLVLKRNYGKAEAVRRGVLRALELSPEFVGYWDADLATPLAAIDAFVNPFADPELMVVMGSRIRRLGADIRRLPWRHYVGRVVATVAASTLELGVYDTQCGAKVFRVGEPTRRVFSSPFELDWLFDVELLARLQGISSEIVGRQCFELALDTWTDAPGSKLTLQQFHRVLSEMLRLPAVVRRARAGAWTAPRD